MIFSSKLYKYNLYCFYHPFIMFQQMISLITILIQFLFKFYLSVLNFLIQSFSFVFSNKNIIIFEGKMSSDDIMEDNSFIQPENEYFLQPLAIESSSNTSMGGLSRDSNISTSSTTKYTSFIWNYCEKSSDGWRCIVKNQNGEPCNHFFPYNTNKGSTSNTISHLRKEHGIVRKGMAEKVFIS